MTEEKKEELRQLLEEAMENLRILKLFERDNLSYSKVGYKNLLNQRLTFYGISIDNSHDGIYLQYKPDIENPRTKARLLEFIRKELNQFIEDDEIRYTSYNIDGCATDGFRLSRSSSLGLQPSSSRLQLSDLLEHLLKVALALGVDKAVSTFDEDSRPDGNIRNYQFIASLEGITIETKIQICRGIRLVPVPHDIAFQLNYILRGDPRIQRERGVTLLIIERLMLSVFHKPSETPFDEGQVVDLPFQVEANEIELSFIDFIETFCQALSLACNTMVMFDYFWDYFAADVFRLKQMGQKGYYSGPIGRSAEAGQSEIEEAKCLYKILEIFDRKPMGPHDQKVKRVFWIASERWRKSKTHQNSEDKIIDLCIAFESLYLSGINDELKFRLSVRAAWFLGKNKDDRKRLLTVFKKIYDCRSTIIHGGELRKRTVTIDNETIPVSELITEAQDLCQKSIVKILKKYSEDGKYPDDNFWNNLILG